MNTDKLTEIEQKHLDEWITYQEEKPIKILLIIAWVSCAIVFIAFTLLAITGGPDKQELNISDIIYILSVPTFLLAVLACLTKLLLKRLKKHRTYNYNIVVRTKILSKEIQYSTYRPYGGPRVSTPYYICKGVKGQITPVSKKYYEMAKVGDMITVVQTSLKPIVVGVTFTEEDGVTKDERI